MFANRVRIEDSTEVANVRNVVGTLLVRKRFFIITCKCKPPFLSYKPAIFVIQTAIFVVHARTSRPFCRVQAGIFVAMRMLSRKFLFSFSPGSFPSCAQCNETCYANWYRLIDVEREKAKRLAENVTDVLRKFNGTSVAAINKTLSELNTRLNESEAIFSGARYSPKTKEDRYKKVGECFICCIFGIWCCTVSWGLVAWLARRWGIPLLSVIRGREFAQKKKSGKFYSSFIASLGRKIGGGRACARATLSQAQKKCF